MSQFFRYQRNAAQARTPYQFAGVYDGANTRTDIYSVAGYPSELSFSDFWNAYRRKPLATAVVNLPVKMCWQSPPKIKCDDEQFLSALNVLVEKHALWERLRGLDLRQRVGQFGGLMLVAREQSKSARPDAALKVRSPSAMVKMSPLFESQLEVNEWDQDFSSAEYGMPKNYQYRSQVPGTKSQGDAQQVTLHPSRVFVFAEGADDGGIYGIPALESCFNALMDAEKIRAGCSEGVFRNAKQRFTIEINDNQVANGLRDPKLRAAFDEDVDDFNKGFDSSLLLAGSKANSLQSNLTDPYNFWLICMNEVAASTGIPVTILIGQMTGRLASDEDQKQLAKFVIERRENTINPMLIRFFKHMAMVGLLPLCNSKIGIEWDNLLESTDAEKIDIAVKMANANKTGVESGLGPYFKVEDVTKAGGYEELDELAELPPEADGMELE